MGRKLQACVVLAAIVGSLYMTGFFSKDLPPLEVGDGWWAKEDKASSKIDTSIRNFNITFTPDGQEDLKRRLQNTRFFESYEGTNWEFGIRADEMQKIVKYWQNTYSWEKQAKILNGYNHFKTNIEGIDIHFIHVKPKVKPGQNVKPMLMVHGWPGSFYEFYKIIPMLTDPKSHGGSEEDTFEIICPSLPGYGFSEASHRPGLGTNEISRILNKLMTERLGFRNYYVQGGDWGSLIVDTMSLFFPENVRGHHSTFINYQPPFFMPRILIGSVFPSLILSEKSDQEKVFPFTNLMTFLLKESGYMHLQSTKPDTVGHGLTDSPVGLAAYILEKFSTWTNPDNRMKKDGGLTESFTMDELLNNVMIYWISGCITSSMRLYKEFFPNYIEFSYNEYPHSVPTGVASFPNEVSRIPEPWLHYKYKSLMSYTDMPKGGHFAAFEQPELLAKDIRQFSRKVEAHLAKNASNKN